MSKRFIGLNLLVQAIVVALVLAIGGKAGMAFGFAAIVLSFIGYAIIRKGINDDNTNALNERIDARAGMVYSLTYIVMSACFTAGYIMKGSSWEYFILPGLWLLLYVAKLAGVRRCLKMADWYEEREARWAELERKNPPTSDSDSE